MEKKRYVIPSVRLITELDVESQILQASNDQTTLLKVDPWQESYYEGPEGEHSDYLINF